MTKTASNSKVNILVWGLVLILVMAGVVANHYYSALALSLRFALWIILVCILLGLTALTSQGKSAWAFIKDARMELRKVVWPTRDETVKTTIVVAALVFVMSMVLWGIDTVLLLIVSRITS